MSYKPYPAYKDSGVEWIGDMPEDWLITKYKRVFSTQNGHGFPNDLQGSKSGDIPFLKVSDISFSGKYVRKAANYVSQDLTDEKGWNVVEANSILAAKIGEALKKNHRKINEIPCLIDNNMMALIPNSSNIENRFLYYLSTKVDFDWYSNPGAVPSLNNSHLREDYVALPSLHEQKMITMFLEESLLEINNLIIQKENMIQLIEEKRQAVITEAMTKGLNPNVPMKDSGVEWIGKIPDDWSILKFKRVFSTQNGHGFPNELQGGSSGEYPFFKVSDISFEGKYVEKSANYVSQEITNKKGWKIVKSNSILVAKIGEALRKNHRKINKVPCLIDNNMMALIPNAFHMELHFSYFLSTIIDFDWYSNPGAVPSLNNSYLREEYIAVPSFQEQIEISIYLEQVTQKMEGLILKIKNEIEIIKEYRESLIYEAVTGKIDLRDYEGGESVGD